MFGFLKKKFRSYKRPYPEILQIDLLRNKEGIILPAKIEALNQSDLYNFQRLLIDLRLANQQLQKFEKLDNIFNGKSFRYYSEVDRYIAEKFMDRSRFLKREKGFYPRKITELSSLRSFTFFAEMKSCSNIETQQRLIDFLQDSSYFEMAEYTHISIPRHVIVNKTGRVKVLEIFFRAKK